MVLNAESREMFVPYSGDGVIVQISVGDLEAVRQGFFGDGKTVVLRRDFNASGPAMEHRLIRTAVSKFHFERFCAAR